MNVAITVKTTNQKTWDTTTTQFNTILREGDSRADLFFSMSEEYANDEDYTDIYYWDEDYKTLVDDGTYETIAETRPEIMVDIIINTIS